MAADPYKYFRLEARELLDQFGEAMLSLEKSERSAPAVQRLLRLAHTLKGAARVVKQVDIADHAHAIEDDLAPLRESEDRAPRGLIDTVLGRIDGIRDKVAALTPATETPQAPNTPAAAVQASDDGGGRTVRADLAEMDALLEGVSETFALLNGLRPAAEAVEKGRRMSGLLLEQLAPRRAGEAGRTGAAARALSTAEALGDCFTGLERGLTSTIDQMDRELRQLRAAAEQLRLAPAGEMFTALERTARDAAQALGKTVIFTGSGGGVRLDAYVLGIVQKALVQLVRNAVAHGVEPPAERRAAGKPAAGRVTVGVARRGRKIVFECRDDGRGLDVDAIRRAATERGLQGGDDVVKMLLQGGISTSGAVTAVSGRGVGLDVVREAVEALSGEVAVRTEAGAGATFELIVPLSVAAVQVLMVEAGETTATIPFDAVRHAMLVSDADISRTASEATIVYQQAAIPFIALPQALHAIQSPAGRNWPVVVVAGAGGLAAVGVDRLLGSATVVMRPLPQLAPASVIVAGASLDAEGDPQLMLDPDGLVSEALRRNAADFQQPAARDPVLVIDDSLTTRMLEQSILESAGYVVDLASSAEEGLESARRKSYALFLVDVEMPGMNGFSFVERIRLDPALHDTPAILVTSLNAPEDLQRGRDVGAQGYIIKSQFDQAELLAMIKRLIG